MRKTYCDKCGTEIAKNANIAPPARRFALSNGEIVLAILRVEYKNPETFPAMFNDDARPFDMCAPCHRGVLELLMTIPPPTEAADADSK